ncbi:MAG: flippase-like domain-containing protein [Caldilineaceae bacterium]|nr:flippase-like domain-containing protein [Caldilineaceae bacterium]
MSTDLTRKIIFSLVGALLLYAALALWSDWGKLSTALMDFPWGWLPAVIGLTLVNYVGRLVKWQWYLNLLGVPIARADSSRIFGVGMLMVMTPGKAGEFLKSYMVKNVTGTPMSVTAPAVLAERLTDGLAMLVLASIGLFAYPFATARWAAAIVFVGAVAAITIIQIRPLALPLLALGRRLPVVKRFANQLFAFYESSYLIFRPRNLLIALTIGMISWAAEGVAYYLVLVGFGAPPGLESLFLAIFIFCISTVIGALFAMPGGLGGVEGSLVFLSTSLLGLGLAPATAAALLIRFCTLWMGVGIGVVCFALWSHLLAGADPIQRKSAPAGD